MTTARVQLRIIASEARQDGAIDALAAIATLAEIVASLLPEEEPEREPEPYKDYLPELLDQPAVAYDPEDPNAPGGA